MPDAVFLDTNIVRNEDAKKFFGNAQKLDQISRVAQIYVPSIVIEEIKRQKFEKLSGELSALKNNYFFSMITCDAKTLNDHIEEQIEALYTAAKKEIDFVERHLIPNIDHVDNLKDMAIAKKAPFEKGSDKGFKDAYIYLIVTQHLSETSDHIYLFTKDNRLKAAFKSNPRVNTLSEPEDYFGYRQSYFKEEYFLDQMNDYFVENHIVLMNPKFKTENIQTINFSSQDEWVITLTSANSNYEVRADFYSREITDAYSI